MFNNLKQKNKKESGFTLVETLIAVAILSLAIVGLMTILGKGISDTNYKKYRITASYLAQEGIEYIRNMRDTYVLYGADASTGWTDFLAKMALCKTTTSCGFNDTLSSFDINSLPGMTVVDCGSGGANCPLFYYPDTGRYSYSSLVSGEGTPINSGFTRVIHIISVAGSLTEIKVSSTVSWTKNSVPYSITFSDNLLKWRGE